MLPNGQIVGSETGLVETLEAVKPYFDEAMKRGAIYRSEEAAAREHVCNLLKKGGEN